MVDDNPNKMVHYECLGENYCRVLVNVAHRGNMNLYRPNDELKIIQQALRSSVS